MDHLLAGFVALLVSWAQPHAHDLGRSLSVEQTQCLTEAIYFESRGEHSVGMAAVAYVALNRTVTRNLSLCDVIHQPGQFSYYSAHHRKPVREADAWMQSAFIATYAQLGIITNPIDNATMYNESPMPSWASDAKFLRTINHHYFYVEKPLLRVPSLLVTHHDLGVPLAQLQISNLLSDPRCLPFAQASRLAIDPRLAARVDPAMREPSVIAAKQTGALTFTSYDRRVPHRQHHYVVERYDKRPLREAALAQVRIRSLR
jgi:hypothetical protein